LGGDRRVEDPQWSGHLRAGQPPGGKFAPAAVGAELGAVGVCLRDEQRVFPAAPLGRRDLAIVVLAKQLEQTIGERYRGINVSVKKSQLGLARGEPANDDRWSGQHQWPRPQLDREALPPSQRPLRPGALRGEELRLSGRQRSRA
jgi:hypothetical protein